MNKIFPIILVASLVLVVLNFFLIISPHEAGKYEDYQMGAFLNTRDEVCESIDLDFVIEVEFVNKDLVDYMGQWRANTNTMSFSSVDIDTIAHEVYHMVETMRGRYNLEDEELRAFMQGAFTECVSELTMLKLNK